MKTVYVVLVDSDDPVIGTYVYAVCSTIQKSQTATRMAVKDGGGAATLRVVGMPIDSTTSGEVIE